MLLYSRLDDYGTTVAGVEPHPDNPLHLRVTNYRDGKFVSDPQTLPATHWWSWLETVDARGFEESAGSPELAAELLTNADTVCVGGGRLQYKLEGRGSVDVLTTRADDTLYLNDWHRTSDWWGLPDQHKVVARVVAAVDTSMPLDTQLAVAPALRTAATEVRRAIRVSGQRTGDHGDAIDYVTLATDPAERVYADLVCDAMRRGYPGGVLRALDMLVRAVKAAHDGRTHSALADAADAHVFAARFVKQVTGREEAQP